MKMLTKLLTGLAAMLLAGSVLADTFYLQATMPTNPDYPGQTDYTRWYDAPVIGTQMASNTPFFGNFFNPNGFAMKTSFTLSEGVLDTDVFPGTIVVDTAATYVYGNYVKTNYIAGIDWSLIGSRNASFRNNQWDDAVVTITNLNVTGLMIFRANNLELNMDLHAPSLTGGGTIQFGTDGEEAPSIWGLDIDNSAFTGTISIAVGNLRINDTLLLNNADLSIKLSDSAVILSSNATFNTAIYGIDVIPAGTYTAAELNSELGTGNFSGSGTLTVLTDNSQTFYLQGTRTRSTSNSDSAYFETAQQWWWDDPVAGNNMTNVAAAAFAGNRFELNGFDYNSWNGTTYTASQSHKFRFGGTLVKNDEKLYKWTGNWVIAGLHVTTNSVTANEGLLLRKNPGGNLTVENFKLDGLLKIRANSTEKSLNVMIGQMRGAGTLDFGRDDDESPSIWGLDVDNSAFAGTIQITKGNLQFNDNLLLTNATLKVLGNEFNAVILSNDVSFASMIYGFGSTDVADGEYTAAQLNALLGTSRFSGSGILTVGVPTSGLAYADWLALYPTLGSLTNLLDDAEPVPDGMDNLLEYALGGNPTNNDAAAILPVSSTDAGWLNLVYNRRADAEDVGLTYTVVTDTDLVFGTMTNEVPVYGTSVLEVDGYVTATNRISTDTDNQAFMQLKVEINP